ncbi:MAG: AAA family ATPase [Nisaea sp.]|uniref:bifunctional aminoglycoside phosphotransferase/ATP-binding protein n=1 Tax=Nisaea sp. TaxID=2024842 RepID=UPI001B057443|nr:bifunctional aminoglycoside phosphotransferase/ATP-binding protein [Nisaea sp.]MBO6559161.1 AAA family ATPase [Nisaea sp.]
MEQTEDQSAALEFLARRDSYDPAPETEPLHVATHGSHVFLVGDRAYKLKRAVAFPYMDYGTLERRKCFTEAELELNRRTAPDLYLGIRRLTRTEDGGLAFDGAGETIEYVLEMRRFAEETLLDRMAESGTLTPALIERTAERIRAFHDSAKSLSPNQAPGAGSAGVRTVLEENFEEFEAQPEHFPPGEVAAYARDVWSAFERVAPLLDSRVAGGQAKHCHGDLHLRNICLLDGEPTLFDGIEFNPLFACIDVLYDLAYFLSDLIIRGRADLANLAFNRYFVDGDYEGLACLPLFISTRSAVRAKIMVSAAEVQDDPSARAEMLTQSRLSFAAAAEQIAEMSPRLIGIGGFSGSGKSTLARALAARLRPAPGALHLRSDIIRKHLFGYTPTTPLPPEAYSPKISARVYALMLERAEAALKAGYPAIMDAVNDRPIDRDAMETLAVSLGVRFDGFWLDLPPEVMAKRIARRQEDASDATECVMLEQVAHGHGPLESWAEIDASGSPDSALEAVFALLPACY